MRVAILPRPVAAKVITSGIARAAWAVNAANLGLTIPLLIEYLASHSRLDLAPLPVGILAGLLVLAVGAAFRPVPVVVIGFLLVSAAGTVLFELVLLGAYPGILVDGFFVLNRPAVSLVLIGVAATTWMTGLAWTGIGFITSTVVSGVVAALSGTPLRTGWGPLLMLSLYVTAYLVLARIQASQRRLVPNFEQLEEETRQLAVEEGLRSRVTAIVHDTLLNDLSLVMNAPDELDERTTDRLRQDISTLTSAQWRTDPAIGTIVVDDQDAELRNELMRIVSDLQWRGLTVHVTGSGSGIYRLSPETAPALLDAVKAALENVLRHSGVSVAEIDLAYADDEITLIISDQGGGFDVEQVEADRLGLRVSITERIRAVGGTVKIWSSPGSGASVVIRVPVVEKITAHEESTHGSN